MKARYAFRRVLIAGLACLGSALLLAQVAPTLPPVMFEVQEAHQARAGKPRPAWVDVQTAFVDEAVRASMGPGQLDGALQLHLDDPSTQEVLRGFGHGGDLSSPRGPDGVCRFQHGPIGYAAPPALRQVVRDADVIVSGELEARTVGYLYGALSTVYALRVDAVLRASGTRDWLGQVVWVRHDGVSVLVDGREICYQPRSWPHTPEVGKRAVATIRAGTDGGPRILLADQAGAKTTVFATDWFFFERPDGGAYYPGYEKVIDGETWRHFEQRLARVAEGIQ